MELLAEHFSASGPVSKTFLCCDRGQKGILKKTSDYFSAVGTLLFSRADKVVFEISGFLPIFIILATLKRAKKIVVAGVLGQEWQAENLSRGKKIIRFFSTKMASLLVVSTEKDMALLKGGNAAEQYKMSAVVAFPPPSEIEFEPGLSDSSYNGAEP